MTHDDDIDIDLWKNMREKQTNNSFSYVIFPFSYATNNERTQTVIPRLFYRRTINDSDSSTNERAPKLR